MNDDDDDDDDEKNNLLILPDHVHYLFCFIQNLRYHQPIAAKLIVVQYWTRQDPTVLPHVINNRHLIILLRPIPISLETVAAEVPTSPKPHVYRRRV